MKNKYTENGAYAGNMPRIDFSNHLTIKAMELSQDLKVSYAYRLEHNCFQGYEKKIKNVPDVILEYANFVKEEVYIPVCLFKKNSTLQALVLFLKNRGFRFSEIALMLNRDQRTVWCTYSKAKTTITRSTDVVTDPGMYVPVSIFSSRNLSVLENLVFYLKSTQNLSFGDISTALGKNYRTIWTVYQRAMNKLDHD